ncbi:MAG: exodeoxyribonuclease VII large subunit [Alphaproteobacteria bacterium]
MSDQLELTHNQHQYSVTELSNSLKRLVEDNYSYIRVQGEISGLKIAPSGHLYFSLKDENSLLSAICWRGTLSKIAVKPAEGLEVICTGSITTYSGQSKYQLIVEKFEHAGVGALMALLMKRKEALEKEGLFDLSKKKKIPLFPRTIGIVTSPTGAVIRDILHRIEDRMPTHILLWPTLVQGEQAANQIANAINGFNALPDNGEIKKPDVIIVARGGGSLEDLWAFNEEIVVRAAANSKIPLISAVGHETDTTLIDYASDLRAPTPTAAAEMAVPVKAELLFKLSETERRLNSDFNKLLTLNNHKLIAITRGLPNFKNIIINAEQRFDDLCLRIDNSVSRFFENKHNIFEKFANNIRHPKELIESNIKNLFLLTNNLKQQIHLYLRQKEYKLSIVESNIKIKILSDKLESLSNKLNEIDKILYNNINNYLYFKEEKLKNLTSLVNSYSYQKTLERGFTIIRAEDGRLVDSIKKIENLAIFNIEFSDGIKTIKN